jgi:hypothetical protein
VAITLKATPPVPESELLSIEASLSLSIPDGYRAFLQVTDGGRPVEDWFSPMVGVTDFLGTRDIVETRSRLRGRLPETLLPIAAAAGGNLVCISVAEGEAGTIYFWNHELEHLGDRAVARLASSFDDFVAHLRVAPPVELPPNRMISVHVDPQFLKEVREQEERDKERPTVRWPT